jgi:hypothetical protein
MTGLFASCGDDKNENPTPKTTSELLMAKSWSATAYTEKVGNATATDEYASAPACFKDNIYKFEAGNKFTADESTLKCASAQTMTGSWALTNSDKTLTAIAIDQASSIDYTITGTVEEISASKFVISETETNNGVTTVSRTTFTAK